MHSLDKVIQIDRVPQLFKEEADCQAKQLGKLKSYSKNQLLIELCLVAKSL